MRCTVSKILTGYRIQIAEFGNYYGVVICETLDKTLANKIARRLRSDKANIDEARKLLREGDNNDNTTIAN